jgi:hypothetical protein
MTVWPEWLEEQGAQGAIEYLRAKGLRIADSFLRVKSRKGEGPKAKYLGSLKLYHVTELDRWVVEDLLKDSTWDRKPKKKAAAPPPAPKKQAAPVARRRRKAADKLPEPKEAGAGP